MNFNTLIELADYILANDLKVSDLGIIVQHNTKEIIADDSGTIEVPPSPSVDSDSSGERVTETTFTNFISKPKFPSTIATEGSNTLTVQSAEVLKDACGTGLIKIGDSTTLMNVCESNGKITAQMSFILEGIEHKNVEFDIVVGDVASAKINTTLLK